MKFEEEDQRYLALHKMISQKKGPQEIWSVIDYWSIYVEIRKIARFMAISGLFESTKIILSSLHDFVSKCALFYLRRMEFFNSGLIKR